MNISIILLYKNVINPQGFTTPWCILIVELFAFIKCTTAPWKAVSILSIGLAVLLILINASHFVRNKWTALVAHLDRSFAKI